MGEIDRDSLVDEIKSLMPPPISETNQGGGDVILVGGDPGEVIVRFRGSKVSISIYAVRWDGPYTPMILPKQLATLNWKRIRSSTAGITLRALIDEAIELRRSQYGKCQKCGEVKPPEWIHGNDCCQSCAERHLGVVY